MSGAVRAKAPITGPKKNILNSIDNANKRAVNIIQEFFSVLENRLKQNPAVIKIITAGRKELIPVNTK